MTRFKAINQVLSQARKCFSSPEAEVRLPASTSMSSRANDRMGLQAQSRRQLEPTVSGRTMAPRLSLPEPSSAPRQDLLTPLPGDVLRSVAEHLDAYDCLSLARANKKAYEGLKDAPVLTALRLDGLIANATTLDQFRELLTGADATGEGQTISSLPEPFRTEQLTALLGRIHLLPTSEMKQAFDLGHEAIRNLPSSRQGAALPSLIRELPSLPFSERKAEFTRCREAVQALSDDPSCLNALTQAAWSVPNMSSVLDQQIAPRTLPSTSSMPRSD